MSRGVVSKLLPLLMVSVVGLATTPASVDSVARIIGQHSDWKLSMCEGDPVSKVEPSNQPQVRSNSLANEFAAGETSNQRVGPAMPAKSAGWKEYVDQISAFSIRYPNDFVIQTQDVSKLTQFNPTPVASIFFMNPTMAGGALAGIEPPDLEVRVYQAVGADSLKNWLESVGFIGSGTPVQTYRNTSIYGMKVCQSTMIAPGCSIYALRKGRVYQLTPMSLDGEAMIETFALSP